MQVRQKNSTRIISLVLIAVCAAFYYQTVSFPKEIGPVASEYGSAFFPRLLLLFIAAMAVILLVQSVLRGELATADVTITMGGGQLARCLVLWLMCMAFYAAWKFFGYLYTAPVFMLATGLLMGARNIAVLIFLVAMGPLMYLVFEKLLQVGL